MTENQWTALSTALTLLLIAAIWFVFLWIARADRINDIATATIQIETAGDYAMHEVTEENR